MLDGGNELDAWDRDHFFHPSTHMGMHARGETPNRIMAGGEGVYVFDRDGRRFYLARPNLPRVDPTESLSEREMQVARGAALGHSNKLIAYELGITPSTVATHLKSAMAKLKVDSRDGSYLGRVNS